jgi:hypothetical protein
MYDMSRIVQARIDAATEKALARLRRRTGLTDSEIIRKGLELVGQIAPRVRAKQIYGLGRFSSGRPDLGSNKKHLVGFGGS